MNSKKYKDYFLLTNGILLFSCKIHFGICLQSRNRHIGNDINSGVKEKKMEKNLYILG